MPKRNLIVISLSDAPLGLHRISEETPNIVPSECVWREIDRIVAEHSVCQKELGTRKVLGYIQDGIAALDIIEHALFLYVETTMSFRDFLSEYAVVPDTCPVCLDEIEFLDIDERLGHIIQCRWKNGRMIIAAAAKAMLEPLSRLPH